MSEWRPIETLPCTAEVVLFGEPGKYLPYMARCDDYHFAAAWLKDATHWMPLPAPPQDAST